MTPLEPTLQTCAACGRLVSGIAIVFPALNIVACSDRCANEAARKGGQTNA